MAKMKMPDTVDVLAVSGGLLASYGVSLFSLGAGLVVLGLLMIFAAWMIA